MSKGGGDVVVAGMPLQAGDREHQPGRDAHGGHGVHEGDAKGRRTLLGQATSACVKGHAQIFPGRRPDPRRTGRGRRQCVAMPSGPLNPKEPAGPVSVFDGATFPFAPGGKSNTALAV